MHILLLAGLLMAAADTPAGEPVPHQGNATPAVATGDSPVVLFDLHSLVARSSGRVTDVAGREVAIRELRVADVDASGFWVTGDGDDGRVFVFPAEGELIEVTPGDTVNVHGDVRLTPESWRETGAGSASCSSMPIPSDPPVPSSRKERRDLPVLTIGGQYHSWFAAGHSSDRHDPPKDGSVARRAAGRGADRRRHLRGSTLVSARPHG